MSDTDATSTPPAGRRRISSRMSIMLVVMAFFTVGAATFYFTVQQIRSNEAVNSEIIRNEVNEAATAIEQLIASRQRLVNTFSFERQDLLKQFAEDVENDAVREKIDASLRRWFPTYFAFTIADRGGTDLVDDLDGFVGAACKLNIQEYVLSLLDISLSAPEYKSVIHPQANNYHFDIMAPWQTGNELNGVFFVSFYPTQLQNILHSYQSPGHHLVLVHAERDNLIEVSPGGARDKISAARPINLTPGEIANIRDRRPIPGSLWEVVGYIEPGLLVQYEREAWFHAAFIIFFLVIIGTYCTLRIVRLDRQQRSAFDQLGDTVAELQDMAEEQKKLRVAAEAGDQAKARFLASMSHEIRTPLNAVIGLTDLALKTDLTDHQRNYLSRVTLAGKNLLGLINDILDFSKIEAGKLEIETIDFELDDVLANLATVVSTKAEENGNEIIISVDRDIPRRLRGDPLRIGQVLINLVGNAAKFTDNGEIIVAVKATTRDSRQWLSISVKDSGIGMTEAQAGNLFQAFHQADQSVTRTHGGTGLGLSISKQLVEAMGGTIGAASVKGEGSTFIFHIPLVTAGGAQAPSRVLGIDPSIMRILVVDDNEIVRDTLRQSLEQMRFNIDTAASGEDAVRMCKDAAAGTPYDLVLMDWQMPGMDGVAAIREIWSHDNRGVKGAIFMISAMNMDGISGEMNALGIHHFLQKPINTSFLLDEMMAFFDAQGRDQPARFKLDAQQVEHASKEGIRILLAEDNELNQMVALGVLESAGFAVDVCEDGRQTLDRLAETGPNYYAMVLMDIQMPVMDGLSATRAIKGELGYADLPVLAMTAHALDEERERCEQAGMVDHITKPIDARVLISKANKWAEGWDGGGTAAGASAAQTDQTNDDPDGASASSGAYFNMEEALQRLMLPEAVLRKLIDQFVEKYTDAGEQMDALVTAGDIQAAGDLAHAIKGVAATLGAELVANDAGALEKACESGADADLAALSEVFSRSLDATITAMSAGRSET